jgi:FtsH-binding integral membrane protein
MQPNFTQGTIARSTSAIQQSFAWMFGGLLVTAITSLAAAADPNLQRALLSSQVPVIVLMLAEIGLVFFIYARITQMSHAAAVGSFLLYSALNGVTFSIIFLMFAQSAIFSAFLSTSLIFGVMALYGFATKSDLSGIGSIAMMLVFGLIIASVVNVFIRSGPFGLLISYATVAIFCALTAYDTQKIKMVSTQIQSDNVGIYGALTLYLDFINIFLALLNIFGGRKDD